MVVIKIFGGYSHSEVNPFSGWLKPTRQKWWKVSGETTRPPIRNKSEWQLGASSWTKSIVRGPGGAGFGVGMDCVLPSVKYPYSLNHNSCHILSFYLSPSVTLLCCTKRRQTMKREPPWLRADEENALSRAIR